MTPDTSPRRRTRVRLVIVFAVLAGALGFLLVEGLGSSLDYFDTVDQAVAARASLGTSTIRLEGNVVPGSIRPTSVGTDFELSGGRQYIEIENTGSPPQLFASCVPVVVVGHFTSSTSDVFVSNQILVKHSSTYASAHPTRVKAASGPTCPK